MEVQGKIVQIFYDILGYLVPGSIFIVLESLLFVPRILPNEVVSSFHYKTSNTLVISIFHIVDDNFSFFQLGILLVIGYLVGHIIYNFGKWLYDKFKLKGEDYNKKFSEKAVFIFQKIASEIKKAPKDIEQWH